MKSIQEILFAIALLLFASASNAQIKNAKTETVKIYGNCEICERTIEKAGNLKRTSSVDWDKDTKMALLTYNAEKTNQAEILKRIALAGYDSDSFLAPDDAYAKLPDCCQYERVKKTAAKMDAQQIKKDSTHYSLQTLKTEVQEVNPLTVVFDKYFEVKDALVGSNGMNAAEKSKALLIAINTVKMDKLPMDAHVVWMKVLDGIKKDTDRISNTKETSRQRDYFITLSNNIYALMKVSKYEQQIYYQFCPMANDGKGANWLSKESVIKNPYYGSQMMTCGKTVETIK